MAEIPPGIRTKETLLQELARRLQFPDYFGANWDALWDCLGDFSWLPIGVVVLTHADLPLAEDEANVKKYLSILRDAVEKPGSGSAGHDLIVGFPVEVRDHVEWLLRSG
ncbi:MAG TPA: barstar family protein [Myxococcaceae bacterium]